MNDTLAWYPGGAKVWEACQDCHFQTHSGGDLLIMGYSPVDVITRGQHHELPESAAKKIAAYLFDPANDFVSVDGNTLDGAGRPWYGVGQPGDKLANGQKHEDADPAHFMIGSYFVLEDDADMVNYIFPDGTENFASADLLAEGEYDWNHLKVDLTGNGSTTSLPYKIPNAVPLPDWNEWLARIHPRSAFSTVPDKVTKSTEAFLSSDMWAELQNQMTGAFASWNTQTRWNNQLWGVFEHNDPQQCSTCETGPSSVYDAYYAWWQLQMVKQVELNTVYSTWDDASDVLGTRAWARQSFGNKDRTWFDAAPHIHGGRTYGPEGDLWDRYLDNEWYKLQLFLNLNGSGFRPNDWKYFFGHGGGIYKEGSPPQCIFMIYSWLKLWQEAEKDFHGPNWRHTSPVWLIDGDQVDMCEETDPDVVAKMTTATLRVINHVMYDLTDPGDWDRGTNKKTLPGTSHVPTISRQKGHKKTPDHFFTWADDALNKWGALDTAVDSLADWMDDPGMWPNGTYTSLQCDPSCLGTGGGSDPGATLTVDNLTGSPFERGETVSLSWSSTNNSGGIKIELLESGSPYKTITASTPDDGAYDWVVGNDVVDDTYTIKMTLVGDDSVTDETTSFSVSGAAAQNETFTFNDAGFSRVSWGLADGTECYTEATEERVRAAGSTTTITGTSDEGCAWLRSWARNDTLIVSVDDFGQGSAFVTMRDTTLATSQAATIYLNRQGRLVLTGRDASGQNATYEAFATISDLSGSVDIKIGASSSQVDVWYRPEGGSWAVLGSFSTGLHGAVWVGVGAAARGSGEMGFITVPQIQKKIE